ncbi:hypothetical protein, partial [uncultured Senegalimassilia sp.]|uniref:hypothetical protein n=1 Tax=uncultured Senegalimassilia sp. TaxID=1714350 RepID=UPI00258D1A72
LLAGWARRREARARRALTPDTRLRARSMFRARCKARLIILAVIPHFVKNPGHVACGQNQGG